MVIYLNLFALPKSGARMLKQVAEAAIDLYYKVLKQHFTRQLDVDLAKDKAVDQ